MVVVRGSFMGDERCEGWRGRWVVGSVVSKGYAQ
jgi:hypothetical protein